MILKLRQRMSQEESGFTLVELLVVMLILGILAAIAIPAFFSQSDKAKDADTKNNVKSVQTALESYRTDNNGNYANSGVYPDVTTVLKANYESTIDDANVTVGPVAGDPDPDKSYEIVGTNPDTDNTFTIDRTSDGNETLSCTAGGTGGCPSGEDHW